MTTIVGIHGVGRPKPGDTVSQIASNFQGGTAVENDSRLRIDGKLYRQSTIEWPDSKVRLIEVNWADATESRTGFVWDILRLGLLLNVLKTFIAMWRLNETGWRESSHGQTGPLWAGKAVRYYLAVFGVVLPPLFVMTMFAFVLPPNIAIPSVVVIALIVAAAQLWLSRFDDLIRLGLLCTIAGLALSLGMIALPDRKHAILQNVVAVVGVVQSMSVVAILFALISLLWKKRRHGADDGDTWITFVTRSALSILPYALITGGYGAVVSASGLYAVDTLNGWSSVPVGTSTPPLEDFGALYCSAVGYNVAVMEFVNGATTFAVGLFLVLGIVACLVASAFPNTGHWKIGLFAQNVVVSFLWLVVVGFLVVIGALGFAVWNGVPSHGDPCGLDVLRDYSQRIGVIVPAWFEGREAGQNLMTIYAASSVRLSPYLAFAFGRLQAVIDIVAGVLLYVLPSTTKPLSISEALNERIGALLQTLDSADTIVIAHSQGSVAARAVISQMKIRGLLFISVGSPLGSLYRRFLNIPPHPIDKSNRWINVYRLSDYVGGEIAVPTVEDQVLKANHEDGHFRYFECLSDISALVRDGPPSLSELKLRLPSER